MSEREELCEDEGCEHHGTTHVCRPAPASNKCPNGHAALVKRALVDSDDRVWSSWLQCPICGWRNDSLQVTEAKETGDGS